MKKVVPISSTLLHYSLPTQQISSFSSPVVNSVTFFPPQRTVFADSARSNEMDLAWLTFNPRRYSFPFISFSALSHSTLPQSLHHLPPFWVGYIYFSEVFLIWQGSRPGRFSPWLQLLSQLLFPAGAALCWVSSSIWGPVFSAYVCVCLAYNIFSSRSWVFGIQIGVCLLLIHHTATDLLRSAVCQLQTQLG